MKKVDFKTHKKTNCLKNMNDKNKGLLISSCEVPVHVFK